MNYFKHFIYAPRIKSISSKRYITCIELMFRVFAVTYEGSLTLPHRVFTAELYDPSSLEFRSMETDTCNLVCGFKINHIELTGTKRI